MVPKTTPLTREEKAQIALKKQVLPFTARRLPWLLGVLMFAAYGLTLNHWVSPDSVVDVASLQGLNWLPRVTGPITYLLLEPFAILPPEWVPVAVNLFTALCAALSLGLLARSVALLPHDLSRTGTPWWMVTPARLMTTRCPWLPPVVAVLVCGFQLTFWQNAITATSQMLDLLMFAYVILCLLEFNVSRRDAWLLRGAFVYGLGMSNDWAMAAFMLPLLVALIGVKRLFLFNEFFLTRLLRYPETLKLHLLWQIPAAWLAGLSLFLLPPAVISLTPSAHMSFWTALKYIAGSYHASLANFPREIMIISCLVSVTPFFLISTHFYQFLAGFSRLNFYVPPSPEDPHVHYLTGDNRWPVFLGTLFFQMGYGFFLLLGLWTMFDSPISPRRLNLGVACLPLYYLGALSIGYFFGHFLLTTEVKPPPRATKPLSEDPSPMEWRARLIALFVRSLKFLTLLALALLAVGYPAALFWKNLPEITVNRADPCGDYIAQLERELPPDCGVIVGSDSFRLMYLQSAVIRSGLQMNYLFLDMSAFNRSSGYVDFIRQNYPGFNVDSILPSGDAPPSVNDFPNLLKQLAGHYEIYYLPPLPVLEPFTEYFYLQAHGLFYRLNRYTPHHPYADPPSPEIVTNNVVFWRTFEQKQLRQLLARINPPTPPPTASLVDGFLNTLRFWPEADNESIEAGTYYASALNDWGVELQREGNFRAARKFFAQALELNPRNAAASINLKFSRDYLEHRPVQWLAPFETARSLGEYGDWQEVSNDGLVDDPNFCFMLGAFQADSRLLRPAIAQFHRVKELSPDRPDAWLNLANLFLESRDYADALSAADDLAAAFPTNHSAVLLKAEAYMGHHDYQKAIPLYGQSLAFDPTNYLPRLNRGLAHSKLHQLDEARRDFNAVLQLSSNAFPAYYDLAEIAWEETNRPAARTNYQLFLKYAPPNNPEIDEVRARLKELILSVGSKK